MIIYSHILFLYSHILHVIIILYILHICDADIINQI